MLELELITRSGPIILMSNTEQGLYRMFRRFISPSSTVNSINAGEPDETDIPRYPNTNSRNKQIGLNATF